MRNKLTFRNHPRTGRSMADWLLFALIGLVAVLSLVVIFRAVDTQQRVTRSFEGWYEDYQGYSRAVGEQKLTGKPMLVYFYATWCPHCKRFSAQILSDPQVQAMVKEYPHVRVAPDNGESERNLMSRFGAEGYPSFFVVLPDKDPIRIETHVGGPDPHMKTPEEFIRSVRQVTEGV